LIWGALLLLAAAALAPVAWSARHGSKPRGRQETAIALHRAQLAELDRDLAEGRIAVSEHATAVLEVQRRLLAAASPDPAPATGSRGALLAALVLVPLAALALYLPGASPNLPAAPLAERIARARQAAERDAALIDELRHRIASLDPKSDRARQGLLLLGNVEDARGNLPAAADAWKQALQVRFDPTLAAQTAEALTRVQGHVTPEAAGLFRQALAAAPPDAPWRGVVEQRLAELR